MLWAVGGSGIVMMRWSFKRARRDGAGLSGWICVHVAWVKERKKAIRGVIRGGGGGHDDYRSIQEPTNNVAKVMMGCGWSGSRITTDTGICSAR